MRCAAPEVAGIDAERVASRDEDAARRVTLRVPPDLACLPGHFPGRPIVPGVVELHWAIVELARWLGREPEVAALEALKFRRPLLPGETFDLRLERSSDGASYAFAMSDASGPISSGRVRVRA